MVVKFTGPWTFVAAAPTSASAPDMDILATRASNCIHCCIAHSLSRQCKDGFGWNIYSMVKFLKACVSIAG